MHKIFKTYYPSEIGPIEITGTEKSIFSVSFADKVYNSADSIPDLLIACVAQLDEYFKGKRKNFSLVLQVQGSNFEKKVFSALLDIPYGKTESYKKIAQRIGHPGASRAVGNANRKNKISIIIPCHRVISGNGGIAGYAAGTWRKKRLLEHEQKYTSQKTGPKNCFKGHMTF